MVKGLFPFSVSNALLCSDAYTDFSQKVFLIYMT